MENSYSQKLGKVVVYGVAVGPEIEPHWQELRQNTELITIEDDTPETLKVALKDADVLIVRSVTKISRDMLKNASNLRGIIKWGVGYENIDVAAATELGLPVVILPVFMASMAEAVFCFLLTITKKYQRLNALVRAGKRPTINDRAHTLENKVLGCVGLGRIGRRVARIALAFEMKLLVYDPFINNAVEIARKIRKRPLTELSWSHIHSHYSMSVKDSKSPHIRTLDTTARRAIIETPDHRQRRVC